jgi:hypothetical protein
MLAALATLLVGSCVLREEGAGPNSRCPDTTIPMSSVRVVANADTLSGCPVKVQGYLRIGGPAALFITAEEATRFNVSNAILVQASKEPSQKGHIVFLTNGERVEIPNAVVDATVSGRSCVTSVGQPCIAAISELVISELDSQ